MVESKVDLLQVDEQDKIDELKQFSDENGFNGCFRTSAKTGKNISESMEFLVKEIIKKLEEYYSKERESTKDKNNVKLDPDKHNEEVKKRKNIFGGCCKWEL